MQRGPPPPQRGRPTAGTRTGPGAGVGGKNKTLQPIVEKRRTSRQRAPLGENDNAPEDEATKKLGRKLKNREVAKKKKEEEILISPGKMAAEAKERRKEEERARREEQEQRIEARAHASKKKEEMDYRSKIRQEAEENASTAKSKGSYETVDEKLILMFKSHCARVTTKLSNADKMSADFKALKEFDGYSSSDRLKLRPQEDTPPPLHHAGSSANMESNNAFLSKPLMM